MSDITLVQRIKSAVVTGLIVSVAFLGSSFLVTKIQDTPPTVNMTEPSSKYDTHTTQIGEPACWPATCLEAR